MNNRGDPRPHEEQGKDQDSETGSEEEDKEEPDENGIVNVHAPW